MGFGCWGLWWRRWWGGFRYDVLFSFFFFFFFFFWLGALWVELLDRINGIVFSIHTQTDSI